MLQSRVISEASSTFVSIREFMVVNRACFQIQGFIFPWLNEMVYTNHVTTSARHSEINDM